MERPSVVELSSPQIARMVVQEDRVTLERRLVFDVSEGELEAHIAGLEPGLNLDRLRIHASGARVLSVSVKKGPPVGRDRTKARPAAQRGANPLPRARALAQCGADQLAKARAVADSGADPLSKARTVADSGADPLAKARTVADSGADPLTKARTVADSGADPLTKGRAVERAHAIEGELEGARALLRLLDELEPGKDHRSFDPERFWVGAEHILEHRTRLEGEVQALSSALEELETLEEAEDAPAFSVLELRLRADARGPCTLTLLSEPGFGTWRPTYTLHVEEAGAVELVEEAEIHHPLGLAAEVSSVELLGRPPPEAGSAPPAQTPWVVRSDRPYDERSTDLHRRPQKRLEPKTDLPEARTEDLVAREDARPDGPFPRGAPPRRTSGPLELRPGPVRARLGPRPVDARLTFVLRPAKDARAFGQLEVKPKSSVPLFAGDVALFVSGLFRSTLALEDGLSDAPWRLDLGPEPRLVARRRVQTDLRVEGVLQRGDVHRATIDIEVISSLPHPAEVQLEDQIPATQDPRLRVRLVQTSDPEPLVAHGTLRFCLRVDPGQSRSLFVRYEIDAPRDYRLVQTLGDDR